MPHRNTDSRQRILNVTQACAWLCVLFIPALLSLSMARGPQETLGILTGTFYLLGPMLVLYVLNYFIFAPKLWLKGKKTWFILANALLILSWDLWHFWPKGGSVPSEFANQVGADNMLYIRISVIVGNVLMQGIIVLVALGARYLVHVERERTRLEEQQRKTAEAELTWLKHQLNPHFLFNTLNNISSLTQIDPDKAQESIGQLSDLLRYALYDSESEKVPLSSEVEFMDNYIDLMALRCNDLTTVEKHLEVPSGPVEVAPLLFISLVENAFKHGVNARYPSFVRISMCQEGEDLVFLCDNSRFPRQGTDRIGSGIGLENMKRRLELLYPGRYTYEQDATEDTYHVKVTLKAL